MTVGQERAVCELASLHAADPDGFQITIPPTEYQGRVVTTVSLRLGALQTADGGLDLRDREEFILIIPSDFPFDYPSIRVNHNRFARFPHVIWSKNLCIYQSKIEWNPSDGLYGFFDRVSLWLGRAATNNMDPIEGPLEPPHHDTDFSQLPFVIRSNAPVAVGEAWFGLAELEKHANRVELIGWNDLGGDWPLDRYYALAVILQKPLPMEFPTNGGEFFEELGKQGLDRDRILRYLACASLFSPPGEPIHLVLGLPMRRAADGSPRVHFAVWTTNSEFSQSLRLTLPQDADEDAIKTLRKDIADLLKTALEATPVKWCRVLEDRNEIVVRRDAGRPLSWFGGKRILILGCGALGSWAADMVARANPAKVTLIDNSLVKPGLLVRQNFALGDIASQKAEALAIRLKNIAKGVTVEHLHADAHKFLMENLTRLTDYDLILDCTANSIFHMKVERDWNEFSRATPRIFSFLTDANAERSIGVILERGSIGGIWDAYVRLKRWLCVQANRQDLISAFYSERASEDLFQPEPGCSEPTFSGSTADAAGLTSAALNLAVSQEPTTESPIGIAFTMHTKDGRPGTIDLPNLPRMQEVVVSKYRVHISNAVYAEARSWVRHNNRIRTRLHETGGLLWGFWDDAANVIWMFDVSGPPPDSVHSPGSFICGAEGTVEEHKRRFKESHGVVGFIGFWHTHPDMSSQQSNVDLREMADLVSRLGENQKRAAMVIFGCKEDMGTADIHIYESRTAGGAHDLVSVGVTKIALERAIV